MTRLTLSDFMKIMDFSCDGFWIYDHKLRVIYANKAALDFCQVDLSTIIGKDFQWIYDHNYFFATTAKNAFETKHVFSEEAISINGKHTLLTSTPIINNGKIEYVITNTRDFSYMNELMNKLKEKEIEIKKYKDKLDHMINNTEKRFISESKEMNVIMDIVERVAKTDATILLLGESGVGKDELARLIHSKSNRSHKEMICVNCASVPSTLLESEFFGYEKGAFTGAVTTKKGFFEQADNSTLMLDEIGELELAMQVKLLRVLQEGKVRRIGSSRDIPVNVRIIAATNQDLQAKIKDKTFRKDLFYRLNVISLNIPPLREHKEDIKHLIFYLLNYYNHKYGTSKNLSPDLLHILENYTWPGNIREMYNIMERLILLCPYNLLTKDYLPHEIMNIEHLPLNIENLTLHQAVQAVEKEMLQHAFRQYKTTREIARALGTSHATVARKLRQYGITPQDKTKKE